MITISLIWGLVVALCCFFWLVVGIRKREPGEPPLENGLIPYVGCALQYGANPLEFLRSREKKHGHIFTCKIAGNFIHFVTDPFSFSSVLRSGRHYDWQKFHYATSAKVFGHSNVDPSASSATEDMHDKFMRAMQGEALEPLVTTMMETLQHTMLQHYTAKATSKDWISEGLYGFCYRLMFESSYLSLFGKELNSKQDPSNARQEAENALILNAIENFKEFDKIFPALVAGIPIHIFKNAHSAREKLAKDLLHDKLKKRDNISEIVSLRMFLNDCITHLNDNDKSKIQLALLWASLANTLPATFWTVFYLLRCPNALKAASDEVHRTLEKASQKPSLDGKLITLSRQHLDDMPVLDSIIKESMRLSSASLNIRVTKENFTLQLDKNDCYKIRKDDIVAFYPQMVHLDPDVYEDPLTFKYDRYIDENLKEKTDFQLNGRKLKYYYLPFGTGKTKCPGRHLAVYEIKEFVSLLIAYFDIELVDKNGKIPPLDQSRAGLGILQPTHDADFKYKLKAQ
ncbi:cytochrome P450 7A1-like [Pelobates fuscus]|uniref:cytochrome P450 7A1-like n=1 Tax=Pelobates fuscus TaxID=191477 RepID=UPI002FE4EA8C